jgi:hypothetical protein
MTLIYFVVGRAGGHVYRLFTDTLLLQAAGQHLPDWDAVNETLDDARRQD